MLEPVESIAQLRAAVAAARADGRRVGFVPTMGALHGGHTRLIERCRDESGLVVVSIFVNPTQFGPSEDLTRYPRTLQEDIFKCESAGADLVFVPTDAVIYPRGRSSTFVEVPGLSHVLERAPADRIIFAAWPRSFSALRNVRPDLACFGQKDYQQQLLIRRMIEDLHVPVELVVVPTVREQDGLAMSSRNRYLDPDQRKAAAVLFRALGHAASQSPAANAMPTGFDRFLTGRYHWRGWSSSTTPRWPTPIRWILLS